MNAHATAETLSAYLDEELSPNEASLVEEHVEACGSCRQRLQGMRNVVSTLHHLERMAPPAALDQAVARRVALAGRQEGLLDKIERRLGKIQRQSQIFFLFALTVALAVIVLLFAQAVETYQKNTPPTPPPPAGASAERVAAGRTFHLVGDLWIEAGADPAKVDVILSSASEKWAELVEGDSRLAEITDLGGPVVVHLAGHTVRLDPANDP